MKKPRIEEIADALGDAKKTLLSVLDGPGEYARFDLEKGPLPVGGAPLVRRSILSYKCREYPGVYLRTSLGSHFIEVSGKEECATYEVDEAHRSLRKVDEPLSAEELRRVLGGASGGLPDDYANQLKQNIGFDGDKTQIGGDLEVDGNTISIAGNLWNIQQSSDETGNHIKASAQTTDGTFKEVATLTYDNKKVWGLSFSEKNISYNFNIRVLPMTMPKELEYHDLYGLFIFENDGSYMPVFFCGAIKCGSKTQNRYNLVSGIGSWWGQLSGTDYGFIAGIGEDASYDYVENGYLRKYNDKANFITIGQLKKSSKERYQHNVTISGEGFEFCFTAPSSKNMVVDSYQDLGIVFGGQRIGLTGYSHALSAKPVLIDLHGGSESNDFIRTFDENGNTFANHTLSSLGAITFADDVYIPN